MEEEVENANHSKEIPDNRFAPVQLDMEETAEPDDLDGISGAFFISWNFLKVIILKRLLIV